MTDPVCPLCTSPRCTEEFHDPEAPATTVYVCADCGMTFLFPSLSPEETRRFNAESYDYGKAIFIDSVYEKYRARIKRQADFITSHIPHPGKALDIGCFQGDLLQDLHERGWRCFGIESAEKACETLKKDRPHLTVHHGFVEDRPFPGEIFDVIIVSRTLNHVLDPVAFLKHLAWYADVATRLYLEVSALASVTTQSGIESGNYFKHYQPVVYTMPTLVDTFMRAGWGGFLHLDTITDFEGSTVYLRTLTARSTEVAQYAARENRAMLAAYRQRVEVFREKRRQQILRLKEEERPFVTWGAGDLGVRLLSDAALADNPHWLGWIDSYPAKWGMRILEREVMPPSRLKELQPDLVVITAASAFAEEIEAAAREYLPGYAMEFICIG
jgi:SAM-dependent methyltransferase